MPSKKSKIHFVLKILVSSIIFSLSFQSVFAATTTNILSSPNSTAIDTPFDIQVNIQGDPNTSYNLKARIGINTSSLTKGLTNNPLNSTPDDWLSDTDSWSKFPNATTDSSGYWQGSLTVKASTTSTIGDNLLIFRIRKVSGSTTTYDITPAKTIILTSASPSPSSSSSSPTSYFTISGIPSEIDSTQNFTVNINLQLPNNQNTDYYLKGAFKKVGATRYFGMTKIGSSWINYGSDLSNQLKITTNSSGQWSGNIEVQPDVLDNDYEGTGDYVFKVGRYTALGGSSWSNEANIKINAKEIEDQGGLVDLSKLSSKEPPRVLGETTKEKGNLPEEVYSLENYRRSATISSTSSAKQKENTKTKPNLMIPLVGGLLLGSGLGFAVFIFVRNRVK